MGSDRKIKDGGPFTRRADGIALRLRLTPKAARARVGPVELDADGRGVLKVAVTAVAEGGKANAALIALLAKTWRLPKGAFRLAMGTTARNKTLLIDGDDAQLKRLSDLVEKTDG